MSPFEAVFGRKPPSIIDHIAGLTVHAAVESSLSKRDSILQSLKRNIQCAQDRMRHQANLHRQHKEFDVGDWVHLRLQPYRQSSVCLRRSNKLARCFYGPFEIIARIGPVAYKLALPSYSQIHNIFHIALLRKCSDPTTAQCLPLSDSFIDLRPAPHPAEILAHRKVKSKSGWSDQLLIQWSGESPKDATWETLDSIRQDFPSFDLEVKVVFDHGGNVTRLSPNKGTTAPSADKGATMGTDAPGDRATEGARRSERHVARSRRYPQATYETDVPA
ncbi:unnamed protein product [Rhodiola kirilowii]